MSVLNSKQDSDRLIRELMVKNRDLEGKAKQANSGAEERLAEARKAQQQLTEATKQLLESQSEAHELSKQLAKARLEFDDKVGHLLTRHPLQAACTMHQLTGCALPCVRGANMLKGVCSDPSDAQLGCSRGAV